MDRKLLACGVMLAFFFVFLVTGAFLSPATGADGPSIVSGRAQHDAQSEAMQTSSYWHIETVDSAGRVGEHTSLALDAAGHPHISYYEDSYYSSDRGLKYAHWDGTSWHRHVLETGMDVGQYTSLALDAAGHPHISYYEDYPNCDLKYAHWDGASWSFETVDSTGFVGQHTSLALDAAGHPHISYYDRSYYALKYARWTGSAWISETVDSAGDVGWTNSLALDSSGHPHISYYDSSNDDLKYAWWDASTWAWQIETVDSATSVGSGNSLALDQDGYPHISYRDSTNDALKYAYWDGSRWHIEILNTSAGSPYDTSLALDATGHPHISYYDASNDDLKYAHWDGASWHIETVDSTEYVGDYNSLVLDAWGNPHISYYYSTYSELKYAWWGMIPIDITIEGGGYAWPGNTGIPVTVSADNQSQEVIPLGGAELWLVYDASVGITLTQVITTARTSLFEIDWTQDASNLSAVEAHILLYSPSGAVIPPGTGAILELLCDVGLSAQVPSTSTFKFSNVMLSDQHGNAVPADFSDTDQVSIGCSRDGDINLDGSTNLYDLQTLINMMINMILHTPQPDTNLHPALWWCRGDLQTQPYGDNQWNVFDLQRLICLILGTCGPGVGGRRLTAARNMVTIDQVYAHSGTSGTFEIDCDNDDAVSAAEIWFSYDSTIGLDVSNVGAASRTSGWSVAFSKDDTELTSVVVHILVYNTSGWAMNPGAGAILSVEYSLDALASGDSLLDVTQVNLADAKGDPLPATWQDGMFHATDQHFLYLPAVMKNRIE